MSNKPVRPDDSDCCGGGCKPCVFDVYEERLKRWEVNNNSVFNSKALDQFQAVSLKKENLNSNHVTNAKLGVDFEILNEFLKINSGEYLIMKGVYKNETISRSYTPALNKDHFKNGVFEVIISLQANGKMSEFLKKLQLNDIVYWRGPFQEFKKDFKSLENILLFGGGTGIVPLYNIAKAIVEDDENEIWVSVTASFKTTDSIILRNEFGRLRDFWNFKMNIYITNQVQLNFKPNYNESVQFKKIDETVIEGEVRKCGGKFLVVICGPEGFNNFVSNSLKKFGVSDENIFIFW